jgi:hypothetical protein
MDKLWCSKLKKLFHFLEHLFSFCSIAIGVQQDWIQIGYMLGQTRVLMGLDPLMLSDQLV